MVQNQVHRTWGFISYMSKNLILEKLELWKHKSSMELFSISYFYGYRYISLFVLDKLNI